MKSITKITSIVAVSTLVIFASGCDRRDNKTTAGEKLDNSIAQTKQESKDAGNYIASKTDKAVQTVDDAAITTAIKAKLVADAELKAMDINVDTLGGVVTLTGAAPSTAAIGHATTVAKSVDGVSDVKNQLTVKPTGKS